MKKTAIAVTLASVATLLTACSANLSGEYGGEDCLYHMNFTPDGKVFLAASLFGFRTPETEGTYEVIEDRVIVTNADGEDIVFTRDEDSLVTSMIGSVMTCRKLER